MATFSVGRLAGDVASRQLQEDLPHLYKDLIKAEFEAKTDLADSLTLLVMLE